jgi:hypothetical protein
VTQRVEPLAEEEEEEEEEEEHHEGFETEPERRGDPHRDPRPGDGLPPARGA